MALRDLAFAGRTLRKSPGFTLTAALTIALGIGASTAIFSVTNAVLLQPLPYKDPVRLVVAYDDRRTRTTYGTPFSAEDYFDIRNGTKGSFEDMGAVVTTRQILPREDGTPEQNRVAFVTPNFLRLLGGKIVAGRDFEEADGQPQPEAQSAGAPNAQAVPALPAMVILSYEFWQRRYGGNPAVIGRNLPGAAPRGIQVVGVLAPRFELLFPPAAEVEASPDIWIAGRFTYDNKDRNSYFLRPVARLKPGVTLERAQAEMESVAAVIRRDYPIHQTSGFYARLEPMHKTLVETARPAILALMGAWFFTRLIGSLLVGVTPADPLTFAAMIVVFFAMAAVSAWLPARRAASLNPTVALRQE